MAKKNNVVDLLMGILCYLALLVLIPFFFSNNSFVKFHAKQGLNLFLLQAIINIISFVLVFILPVLTILTNIAYFICGIMSIVGIIYVIIGKKEPLPIVGKFKLIK